MGTFLMVVILAVFVNNFVVVQFLGICPFLGLSKSTSSAVGMGVAVTVVMMYLNPVITAVLTRIFFKESFTAAKTAAIFVNIAGCVLMVTGGDFSAGGAAQACLEHGLKLKEDFFVVGLTDLPETARRRPALSVQSVPYRELAASSLAMLERLIASGQPQPSEVLDNRLIIRET